MRVTRLLKWASFEILSSVPGRHICRKSRRHVGRRATTPSASCRAPFPTPGNQSGNRLCSLSFLKNLRRNPVWNRMAPMFLRTGELPPKHFIIIFHQLRHLQIHGIFWPLQVCFNVICSVVWCKFIYCKFSLYSNRCKEEKTKNLGPDGIDWWEEKTKSRNTVLWEFLSTSTTGTSNLNNWLPDA